MLVPMRGLVVVLFAGFAVAACASDGGSLGEATPLASDAVPLPRPAPKSTAAVQAAVAQDSENLAASSLPGERSAIQSGQSEMHEFGQQRIRRRVARNEVLSCFHKLHAFRRI